MTGLIINNFSNDKKTELIANEKKHSSKEICVTNEMIHKVKEYLKENRIRPIIETFKELHLADQAILIQGLKSSMQNILIINLKDEFEPYLLDELSPALKEKFLEILGPQKIAKLIEQLEPDDIINFLTYFSRKEKLQILKQTNKETRKIVNAIQKHEEETAGYIMDNKYLSAEQDQTIEEALKMLNKIKINGGARVYDLLITDKKQEIVGIVDLLTLITTKSSRTISEIMKKDFVSVNCTDSAREIVYIFNKYNLNTVPVLDENGTVKGSISIDTVKYLSIEQDEEDILKMSGVLSDLDEKFYDTIKVRFIWLFINLITSALCSVVISAFEETVSQITALAILMPITVSMGSNAGTQTITVIIRALATKQLNRSTFKMYFNKEMLMSLINSIIFGILLTLAIWKIYDNIKLGLVFGAAITLTLLTSVISGIITPIVMKALKTDPAITAIVFLTAIVDVVAFASFLWLAKHFLT